MKDFLPGFAAASFAEVSTLPADTAKVKMQVSPSKYQSFFQTIHVLFSEKGVRGFYGGLR